MESDDSNVSNANFARSLNINIGNQKNIVLIIQGCSNGCPDVYAFHTFWGGDFHNCGYLNECLARIVRPGRFWHVTEKSDEKAHG